MEKLSLEFLAIEQDNQSGSLTILDKTIRSILEFCIRHQDVSLEAWLDDLTRTFQHLVTIHNQFGALHHLNQQYSTFLTNGSKPPTGQILGGFFKEYRDKWKCVDDDLARSMACHIALENKRVLLHSKSSSLTRSFQFLREKGCRATIFQTESRPALEGRHQAELFMEMGFDVHLIVDSAVSTVLDRLDLALLGADNVTPQFFVNKIGSHGIALLCREAGIPVYVLADTRKFMITKSLPEENLKRPDEIWKAAPKELSIINLYFERIPNDLVDGFITEAALETPQTLSGRFS